MGAVGVFVTFAWERDSGVSHQTGYREASWRLLELLLPTFGKYSGIFHRKEYREAAWGTVGVFVTFAWEKGFGGFPIRRGYQEAA